MSEKLCDLELAASLENVAAFRKELGDAWKRHNLPHGKLNGLVLVITELCNNACEYADPTPSRFKLVCQLKANSLEVIISDNGQSFNPHDGVNPNFWNDPDPASFDDSRGAGCYLILNYFPDMIYRPSAQNSSGLNETVFNIDL